MVIQDDAVNPFIALIFLSVSSISMLFKLFVVILFAMYVYLVVVMIIYRYLVKYWNAYI